MARTKKNTSTRANSSRLTPADRADVEKLLDRKLKKHGGDAHAGLAEVTSDPVRQTLAGVADDEVRHSLAGLTPPPPRGHVLLSTTAPVPEARAQIANLLRRRHGLSAHQPNYFNVFTQDEVLQAFNYLSLVATAVLAGIVGISLLALELNIYEWKLP